MDKKAIITTMEAIGLTPNEAAVYVASLSVGPSTVAAIARAAGIERTNTYRIIESLQEQGLMSVEVVGLKKRYVPESPEATTREFQQVTPYS